MAKSQIGLSDLIDVLGIRNRAARDAALEFLAERLPESGGGGDLEADVFVELPAAPPSAEGVAASPADERYFAVTQYQLRTATPVEPDTPRTMPLEPAPPCKPVAFRPLMPKANLLATLRIHLRSDVFGTEPDVESIVERVSRCERIEPVPRRKRRRWGSNLVFVEDRSKRLTPFWDDQDVVRAWLAEFFPRDRITVLRTSCESPEIWTTYPKLRDGYELPHPDDTVIALSDLGCLAHGESATTQRWIDLGRVLRENGNHTLALVPTTPSAVSAALRALWKIIPWGSRRRLTEHERKDSLAALLAMASQAMRLEPGLLRELRLLLPSGRDDPGLESLVWQHDSLSSRGVAGASFHSQFLDSFRSDFAALPPTVRAAALAGIRDWVVPVGDLCWEPTVLALDAAAQRLLPNGEVDRAVEAVKGFVRDGCGKAMTAASRAWGSSAVERLRHSPIRHAGFTQALTAIYREVRRNSDVESLPDWFDLVDPDTASLPERTISVRDRDGKLVFSEATSPPGESDGFPLATIRSRNGELVLGDVDLFWASGRAPTWASAWGVDEYGRWAEFTFGAATQRMRWIEPGTFRMGSPDDEEGRYPDEGPVHEVTITRGYWLFDTPCCQDLWNAVGLAANPSQFTGQRRPVESVTWAEAVAFLDRLNEAVPGLELRLPREAEWEYACRAGTLTARYGELDAIAWHVGNSGKATRDVAQKLPNVWGLFDTLGNVWEWCLDDKRAYTAESVVDPDGGRGSERVFRGGSWAYVARVVRAAYRYWLSPGDRHDYLGFRALSSGASPAPGGRVRIGYLRRAEPDARGSAPEAPKKTRIPVHGLTTAELPRRREFELQSDVETCVFERIAKPSWARDFGRDRYGLWCTLEIGDVVQRMRWIPPGRFMMGSPPEEEGRYEDEGPMHPVVLTAGYWLFDTPCTQALWSEVMNGDNPSRFRDPLRPVENVTYDTVMTFLDGINDIARGLGLTLPTEAQWEYACRAATTTATYAGDLKIRGERDAPVLDAIAWYGGNSGHKYDLKEGYDSSDWREKQYPHTKAGTRRVATKDANRWGLYDMLGNVWEWCFDSKREYTDEMMIDPDGGRGSDRVVRGGSWIGSARNVRAALRRWDRPGDRDDSLGFRALSSGASSGKAGGDASG